MEENMDNRNIWTDCIGSDDTDFWDEIEQQEENATWEN
jgi:hypothetical protein